MIALDEILGWIVAGTVTLGGALAASHLAERNRRQRTHFKKVKSLAVAPLSSWIANLRPLPHLVTPFERGFKPTSDSFTTLDTPELACVRRVHYPTLVRDWDPLYRDYLAFAGRTVAWAQAVDAEVAKAVGGRRTAEHRKSAQFPGYRQDLVVAILEGFIPGQHQSIPLTTEEWKLDPASLDDPPEPDTDYVWITIHGTTVINLLLRTGENRDYVLARLRADVIEIATDEAIENQAAELIAKGKALQTRMTAFKSRLARILNLDETLPGTCESVEPRWYFRLATVLRGRSERGRGRAGRSGPA